MLLSHSRCGLSAQTGLLVDERKVGAVVYLISNSRLSETCFILLKIFKIKIYKKKKRKFVSVEKSIRNCSGKKVVHSAATGGTLAARTDECFAFFTIWCFTLVYFIGEWTFLLYKDLNIFNRR